MISLIGFALQAIGLGALATRAAYEPVGQ